MDPNLFNLDEGRLFDVLFVIVVLSFFVERALSVLVGWRAVLSFGLVVK